ncbi:hypothetical protein APHAL10511_007818 [Amanita phalloides]|nr:hypothetical protein APHAL10511_007818 [Amanita phalloides]
MRTAHSKRLPSRSRTHPAESQSLLNFSLLSDAEAHRFKESSNYDMKAIVDRYADYSAGPGLRRVAHDTTMKTLPSHEAYEAFLMTFVAEHTTIPVPRIKRIYTQRERTHILMDHIDGVDLATAWPRLPFWRKLYIAWVVRGYVKQLRRVALPHPDVPGPFDDLGKPFVCKGHFFTSAGAGPFPSHRDMCEWFHRKQRIAKVALKQHGLKSCQTEFVDSDPLVLVNGNISPRHIRIGKDGKVWLVDWSLAGVYPKTFEYCGIMADGQLPDAHRLWTSLAPWIAAGSRNKRQWDFLCSIKLALFFRYDESDFLW